MTKKEEPILMYMKKHFGWTEDKLPLGSNLKVYPKGHILLRPGEMETHLYFLVSGIVEVSIISNKGEEKIMNFFFSNNLFCSMASLITNKPTKFFFRCVTECTIESVSYKEFNAAMKKEPILNTIYRLVLEQFYLFRIKKETDMLTKNASDRYLDLIKYRQDIIKEIPLSKIAKYLGIHPRSLSRIRRSVYK